MFKKIKSKYQYVMLDVETLDNVGKSTPFMISMVAFNSHDTPEDIKNNPYINIRVSVSELTRSGFTVGDDTLRWWLNDEQSRDTLYKLMQKKPISITSSCERINDFLTNINPEAVWASAVIDFSAIDNLFDTYGCKNPIPFNCRYDFRSLRVVMNEHYDQANNHNPLEDCYNQINTVNRCLNRIKNHHN